METPAVTHPPIANADSPLRGKRAAVIVFAYYPSDVRVMRSAQAMHEAGMEVELLCLQQFFEEPRRERIAGVEVFRTAVKKCRGGKLSYAFQYLTFFVRSFFWLFRGQLGRRYDVVHIHNMPDFLVFSAVLAKLLGAQIVLDLHDPTPEVFISVYGLAGDYWLVRLLRYIEKLSISFADLVLTPNVAFRDLFVARSCPPNKIKIVMNSPLEEVFPFKEPSEQVFASRSTTASFVVMYHGTLVERHGLHTAVEAIALLREIIPSLRFHIYGEETPYLRDQILPLVEKLELQSRVQYFGEQPQHVISRAVSNCDLGVVPNLRTVFTEINLPTRIFEYLALGKPVIVPKTRGIQDYFNVDNMLFFGGGEVESLASQIKWVFDHPREASAFARKGQDVYRSHLWTGEERRLIDLFAGLIRDRFDLRAGA
jgi:glycosyltransferase involved in cell wall biosynthesis